IIRTCAPPSVFGRPSSRSPMKFTPPVRRSPSATMNSAAIVPKPSFENPPRASAGLSTPATSSAARPPRRTMSGEARVRVRPAMTAANTTNVTATATVIGLLHAELGQRLEDLRVERTVGDDDPPVLGELPALGEVERLARHVGDRAARL